MKYIIVAIIVVIPAALLGAGIEFERGTSKIKINYAQLGFAYGFGNVAGMKHAIKVLKPDEELPLEQTKCSDYRMLWEAVQ